MNLFTLSSSQRHRYLIFPDRFLWLLCLSNWLCHGEVEAKTLESHPVNSGSNLLFVFPDVENWEAATLRFQTPCRHKRDLIEREHHVLALERPGGTIRIHVSKKPTLVSAALRVVVHEENGTRQIDPQEIDVNPEAVFTGEVVSNLTSVGSAALSACHNNSGLCGLIITEEEHLLIQPSRESGANHNGDDTINGVPTAVYRIDESLQRTPGLGADGVHVPLDKLRAAAAAAGAATSHNAIQEFQDDDDPKDTVSTLEAVPEDENVENNVSLKPMAYSRRGLKPKVAASTSANGKNVVEIAVFTDEDFYNNLRKQFPSDTVNKLKDYVITLINAMDLLYQHPSLGEQIEFSLVHLEIMKRPPAGLNKNGGRAMAYLTSFCDYSGAKNINGEMWDHALLLTGTDLHEDATTATAGLAWAGTMCYRYYSCSVSEGTSFGAAYIITHEIGHSLGMEHDGMGISKSCDMMKYLMSPTTGPGKVEWSSCSRQNLKDFLKYGTAELRNTHSAHKPTCLTTTSMRSAKKIEISEGNQTPGKKYNATMQCKLAMGVGFRPVLRKTEPPFDNICWMLYCGNGTHAVSTHPALEGTKCDDNKVCKSGKCVNKS